MGTTSEKLTYLNTTKTLIKDNLNLGGANITNEPFRAYSTKLIDIYKDFLANGTSTLWSNWEKVSGSGTSLSLSPTIKGKMNIDLKGNTYQETTTQSANLFDKNRVDTGYLNADGTLYTSATGYRTSDYIPIQPNTAYYKTITGSPRTKYYDSNKQVLDTSTYQDISIGSYEGTFTTPNNAYYLRVSIHLPTISVDDVMIHKGSSAIPYVPFVPNSPSPDYPQDIHTVSGDNTIKVEGKNLIDTTAYNKTVNSSGVVQNASTPNNYLSINDYIELKPNTTYTISFQNDDGGNLFISTKNSSDVFIERINIGATRTFTTDSNTYYGFLYIYKSGGTYENVGGWVQLEYGNQSSSYTPYETPQTLPINLGTIELCKIGTYQDYLYKDSGKWYVHKEIGKVVLDGSENWSVFTATHNGYTRFLVATAYTPKYNFGTLGGYSNYFITGETSGTTEINLLDFRTNRTMLINTNIESNVNDFKTWLSTHNTTLYYVLKTPTNTEITDNTLINQLNDIENAYSYENQTNISQTNNDMPFILDVIALKEIQ